MKAALNQAAFHFSPQDTPSINLWFWLGRNAASFLFFVLQIFHFLKLSYNCENI